MKIAKPIKFNTVTIDRVPNPRLNKKDSMGALINWNRDENHESDK